MNSWLDMDRITNVYIDSIESGVLERQSKECDPILLDTIVKNKWDWNWLTKIYFSEHWLSF